MSKSKTPETDAFFASFTVGNDVPSYAYFYDWLKNMEIQRYEARAQLQAEREIADRLAELVSNPASEWGWEKVNALAAWKEARKP